MRAQTAARAQAAAAANLHPPMAGAAGGALTKAPSKAPAGPKSKTKGGGQGGRWAGG